MARLRTAVVGVGTFGQQHARVLASLPLSQLVAVVDANRGRAEEVAARHGCEALDDPAQLDGRVDAVIVAVPTSDHTKVGVDLLRAGIDVLIEKPIAPDLASADALIRTAREQGRILQVGHLERFNPIVEAAQALASLPLFFEVHRMSVFTPRSLDVDVILDLMIHDIEIILSMVNSPIERLEATGVPILSPKADIGSVRLIFQNGCVANLTASRISAEKIRKLRFFQPRQYISVDYDGQEGSVFAVGEDKQIANHPIAADRAEPLARQNEAFLQAVENRGVPRVPGEAARDALEVALRIVEEMRRHNRIVAETLSAEQR